MGKKLKIPKIEVILYAPNHFIINTHSKVGVAFQSYRTIVVLVQNGQVYLDKSWNCTRTTSKYVGRYLMLNSTEIKKAIKEEIFIIADLNHFIYRKKPYLYKVNTKEVLVK
jgi:hypothetical protein